MCLELFEKIRIAGGQAYFVGGYVRDKIIGVPNKDVDIEVFGLNAGQLEKVLDCFGKWKKAGTFEVYILNNLIEISLCRNSRGETDKEINMTESAERRDLTINAIYYNPLNDRIIDPLNGAEDINKKELKFCSAESFMTDPLRILRTVYFSAKYGFEVNKKLEKLIIENKKLILNVAKERVYGELEKMLMNLERPSEAFKYMKKLGILELIAGETEKQEILDKLSVSRRTPLIMWTKLYLIKKSSDDFGFIFNKKLIREIKNMLEAYNELLVLKESYSEYGLKKIAVKAPLKELLKLYKSNLEEIREEDRKFVTDIYKKYLKFRTKLTPLIMGRDLIKTGFENREKFGLILNEIYEEQLKEGWDTKEDALNYVKNRYKEFTNLY